MAKRPATQPSVVVRNIDELSSKPVPKGDQLLIHFTKAQWAAMTKGMRQAKALPKRGVVLAYTPLPDDTGGIAVGDCISGPCQICMIRPRRGPDDIFGMECQCRRDPECPPDLPPPSGNCRLVFRRQGLNWRMVCENIDCRNGNCQVSIVRDGVRWLIGCACQ